MCGSSLLHRILILGGSGGVGTFAIQVWIKGMLWVSQDINDANYRENVTTQTHISHAIMLKSTLSYVSRC